MADSSIQICYFFQRAVYKQKLFSVTKLPDLINKNTKQYRKPSYQVIGTFVDPLINPRTGSKNTSVLMSLGMSLSDLLTHSV